jgi:RimJ/RimL family protein N-acetyltransferase
VTLQACVDAHFGWMLSGNAAAECDGLALPPGGVDDAPVLELLRGIAGTHRAAGRCGMWLIVCEGQVAGLCGFLEPPREGRVEIGYGVAASWRARGVATQAVAELLAQAAQEGIAVVLATTTVANRASQIVLERNGFAAVGRRVDEEDGDVVDWKILLF